MNHQSTKKLQSSQFFDQEEFEYDSLFQHLTPGNENENSLSLDEVKDAHWHLMQYSDKLGYN